MFFAFFAGTRVQISLLPTLVRLQKIIALIFNQEKMERELKWYMDRM